VSDNITLPREVVERLVASWGRDTKAFIDSMDALRTALAAPRPEPVAWGVRPKSGGELDYAIVKPQIGWDDLGFLEMVPLYTAPPAAAPPDIEALRRDAEKWRRLLEGASIAADADNSTAAAAMEPATEPAIRARGQEDKT
jgi:hypothetical protein